MNLIFKMKGWNALVLYVHFFAKWVKGGELGLDVCKKETEFSFKYQITYDK